MSPTEAGAPAYEPTQEVRFAVVLYGGVSLAIYINGVVQELLSLVRATAPERPAAREGDPALLRDDELKGAQGVYRALGRMLAHGQEEPAADAGAGAPIRTRFVVDILSGTSAGGINGVYLAKALVAEQPIDALQRLWIEEGDIEKLVNDPGSYADLDGLAPESPPASILNSQRMYWKLLAALDGMDTAATAAASSPLVDELDLWVTATSVRGVTVPLDLSDRMVFERRYRKAFRFRYRNALAAGGPPVTEDFVREQNPMLAFSARATSAFPVAFEPVRLKDIDDVLARGDFAAAYGERLSSDACWRRFFPEVAAPPDALAESLDDAYRYEPFADGGYLDNKPFSWAAETLPRRRADLPVDRRFIYVEPDPESAAVSPHAEGAVGDLAAAWRVRGPLAHIPEDEPEARPDALSNVLAAKVGIPTYEPIREDLERLLELSREAARLATLVEAVDPRGMSELDPHDDKAVSARGVQYLAYLRLRVAATADVLAELVTGLAGFDEDSDERSAIRCLAQVWLERAYPPDGPRGADANAFLAAYDLEYRIRRDNFISRRASRALEDQPGAQELLGVKRALGDVLVKLRAADRGLRAAPAARAKVAATGLTRDDLASILRAGGREASLRRAGEILDRDGVAAKVDDMLGFIASAMEDPFAEARRDTEQAVATLPDENDVRLAFTFFELYDSIRFPIGYGAAGELSPVRVIRISPPDATAIFRPPAPGDPPPDGGPRTSKLAGATLHHFGGFFEEQWRRNDLLWGRLDAAERIVSALLPPGDLCHDLVTAAHDAILADVLDDPDACPAAATGLSVEQFRALLAQGVHAEPDADALRRLGVRLAPVVEQTLRGIAADRRAPALLRVVVPGLAGLAGDALKVDEEVRTVFRRVRDWLRRHVPPWSRRTRAGGGRS